MNTRSRKNKFSIKGLFFIVSLFFFFLLLITVCLFIVTRETLFDFFKLSNDEANIGAAIGGIGAVIVGIGNIIMLYLAFEAQRQANLIQGEKLDREIEKNKLEAKAFNAQIELFKEEQRKASTEIELIKKKALKEDVQFKINQYISDINNIKSKWRSLNIDCQIEDMDKLGTSNQYSDILFCYEELSLILSRIKKSNISLKEKNEIYGEVKLFFKIFMLPMYETLSLNKEELKEPFVKIERIISISD